MSSPPCAPSSPPSPRLERRERWALVTFLLVLGVSLLGWVRDRDFLPYRQDLGETFVAYQQSGQLRETFPRYGMLHVETGPSGRPKVYTHNVNLGTHYFFLWRLLGLEGRTPLMLTVLPVYLAGLALGFLAVRTITGSRVAAWAFLALMTLDFGYVGAFAFNSLRAWHYVGLFATLLGVHGIAGRTEAGRPPVRSLLLTAFGCLVSFGCGYDFFVIAGACAGFHVLLAAPWRRLPGSLGWLFLCSLAPFVLRQAEVIYWMGWNTWYTDFYVTFAIKVPFASRFIAIPPIAEIDALYEQAGLMRPPAYPTSTLAGIWNTFLPLLQLAVLPNYGLVGGLALAGTVLAGLAGAVLFRRHPLTRTIGLSAACGLGAVAGLLVFAPFSLHVYLKHHFPLVAGLIHLAEATVLGVLFHAGARATSRPARIGAALAAAALVANAIAVQIGNAYASKELDLRWMARGAELATDRALGRGEVIATGMAPPESSPGPMSSRWTTLAPDHAPWILARAAGRLVPRPVVDLTGVPEAPRLLLYAPGDGWSNLDARQPDLRHRDWLLTLLAGTPRETVPPVPAIGIYQAPVQPIHPDDVVALRFLTIPAPNEHRPVPMLEIETADGGWRSYRNITDEEWPAGPTGVAALVFNRRYSMLQVHFRLPGEYLPSPARAFAVRIRARMVFGLTHLFSDPVTLQFSPDAARRQVKPILPEPTTGELATAFRDLPLIERSRRGVGYAIFELPARAPRPTP